MLSEKRFQDVLACNQEAPLTTLNDLLPNRPLPFLVSTHIVRVLNDFLKTCSPPRPLTPFETAIGNLSTPSLRKISHIRKNFISRPTCTKPAFLISWEIELRITLSESETKLILKTAFGLSSCVTAQESHYKLLAWWYRTPQ
ncbi:hypothetical protein GDO78_019361 [Eleutherodactylus coqui]|uniref:Uncharacterized protein n=1 Tax=Eleutherodactylus coqui TaxID=57060 RepID=A0A8J6EBR1_ELECQ|nr:hypothetical protein GDO78_019361 [Eleutherodactylus coqui]